MLVKLQESKFFGCAAIVGFAVLSACVEHPPECEVRIEYLALGAVPLTSQADPKSELDQISLRKRRDVNSARLATELRSCPSVLEGGLLIRGAEGGDRWLPIELAALTDDTELMMKLLDRSVDWLAESEFRQDFVWGNALHIAAYSSRKDLVSLLVQYGFDVNHVSGAGFPVLVSAVDGAAVTGMTEAVDELLRLGANPRGSSDARVTPLEAAIYFGAADAARKLVGAGATEELTQAAISDLIAQARAHGQSEIADMISKLTKRPL